MSKDEILAQFFKNVEFLHKTISPDDIYIFAEQTFMAAMFFLHKYREKVDLKVEKEKDSVLEKYVNNLLMMADAKDHNIECNIDLGMEQMYEDDN